MLAYLFDHVENELFQWRFRWREDSIAFWDNRCAQHRAMWDYWPHTRWATASPSKGIVPTESRHLRSPRHRRRHRALLAAAGHAVTLIARGDHLEGIRSRGLAVQTPEWTTTSRSRRSPIRASSTSTATRLLPHDEVAGHVRALEDLLEVAPGAGDPGPERGRQRADGAPPLRSRLRHVGLHAGPVPRGRNSRSTPLRSAARCTRGPTRAAPTIGSQACAPNCAPRASSRTPTRA